MSDLPTDGLTRALVAADAPFGIAGIGRHLDELVALIRDDGLATTWLANASGRSASANDGQVIAHPWLRRLTALPLVRGRLPHRVLALQVAFDRGVARRLPVGGPDAAFVGFAGQGLASLTQAGRLGYGTRWLLAATSHVDRVKAQHRRARQRHPIEPSWLGARLRRRTLAEYQQADLVLVASSYTWDSFVAAGVAPGRLRKVEFRAHPRFRPGPAPTVDRFVVTYTGRLTVDKGIPLLVEAVSSLTHPDLELVLVGGCSTPAMRRWLAGAVARDPRIRLAPGDPLPELHRARLHVHPTWEDGLGYGPLEAAACGVPLVVSEDTGMKDQLDPDGAPTITPTGDGGALRDAIDVAYRAA